VADYASRVLHPLCRALSLCHNELPFVSFIELNSRTLFGALLEVLTSIVFRLEEEFAVFMPLAEEAIVGFLLLRHARFDSILFGLISSF
jgi:hypothetical protein